MRTKKRFFGDYRREHECLVCRCDVGSSDDGVCSDVCRQILGIRREADQWDAEYKEV